MLITLIGYYFQPPTRREKLIALRRVNPPNEIDPYKQVKNHIEKKGYPYVVAFGDSHIVRLARYARNQRTPEADRKRLKRFYYVAVGGTKINTCLDEFEGKNLPVHKQFLSDQILKLYIKNPKCDYLALSIGSNDVDEIDRYTKVRYHRDLKNHHHKAETDLQVATWITELKAFQKLIL